MPWLGANKTTIRGGYQITYQLGGGRFNTYSDPYVGLKGPDNWWCCTWWGGKALYETARHLYAASATEDYVNGFMPSAADLRRACACRIH